MHDLNQFLEAVDFIVVLVGHREIVDIVDQLKDKIILDTRNICHIEGAYKL